MNKLNYQHRCQRKPTRDFYGLMLMRMIVLKSSFTRDLDEDTMQSQEANWCLLFPHVILIVFMI